MRKFVKSPRPLYHVYADNLKSLPFLASLIEKSNFFSLSIIFEKKTTPFVNWVLGKLRQQVNQLYIYSPRPVEQALKDIRIAIAVKILDTTNKVSAGMAARK